MDFDKEDLLRELEEIFDSEKFKEVWIVGSMADPSKEVRDDSDIDVCIIVKKGTSLSWPEDERKYPGEAIAEVNLPDDKKRHLEVWEVSDRDGMSSERVRIY